MGKVKQRRHRGARYNPTGITTNGQGESPETRREENQVAGFKLVHEKLDCPIVEERICGLNTLAALALEDCAPSTIVAGCLIEKVAALLKDPSVEVRVAAAGTLRNVSAGGSDDVVEAMVQQDVLTPLAELLKTYTGTWAPTTTDLGQPQPRHLDPMTHTFIHATNLLWNLCECSEEAVTVFNQEGLINILVPHLDPATWGHDLALAVAECLLCVSENNSTVASALLPVADSLVSHVSRPVDSVQALRFATTLAGVLLNINYCSPSDSSSQLILRMLAETLKSNPVEEIGKILAGASTCDPPTNATSNGTHTSDHTQDLDHLISAQQLAFELLSNICCPEEEEEEWEECGSLSGDEDVETMEVGGNDGASKDILPPEVVEGLRHYQLFQIAISRIDPLDSTLAQQAQTLDSTSNLIVKLGVLRVRALMCVQNMAPVLDVADMGGADAMYAIWLNLGSVAFKNPCTETGLLEAATGAMRAIMDRLSQDQCEKLASITHQDLQMIFDAGVSCSVGSVRANIARMVGTLSCLVVAHTPGDTLTAGPIGAVLSAATNYLLKVAASDSELWVSAEALDVLIDLYSDDKTDHLAQNTNLVERLKGIHPHFKAKHKQNKKSLGEHRALILTVKDNLMGFIKYKASRTAKLRKT